MKKPVKVILFFSYLFILLLSACRPKNDTSILEQVLALAGENRGELEKVLTRYQQSPGDSLKYRAACFLIENMPYYYYFEGEWTSIPIITRPCTGTRKTGR
jgi:hypothetical protein